MTPIEPITNFADRLCDAVARAGAPACVGLDPVLDRLPASVREGASDGAEAIESFCRGALGAIAGIAPAVKVQSACFERFGAPGVAAMERIIAKAREHGLIVILDAKRGDIGVSAEHYAAFAFDAMNADGLTVNPYLGADTLEPYISDRHADRGLFVLVRTSNPGSDGVQRQVLIDGRSVAELAADITIETGAGRIGASGFSSVGAVVAATKPADARSLRQRMPRQIFLVPGYGAQGGDAASVRELFTADGRGAIVTASRSVLYAFEKSPGVEWRAAVRDAAAAFAREVAGVATPGV